jgi:1-acyl-sn-glycerol-3-phosphate acyltransferase
MMYGESKTIVTGTGEPQSKPPFMPSKKKLTVSNDELKAFYRNLREYYLNLPYDRMKVALEEISYRDITKFTRAFARIKQTTVLHKERIEGIHSTIYTANHIGSFDQFYVSLALGNIPLHYLVKKKVTTWPLRWNIIYKPTGAVVVDQESITSWQQAKAKLIQYLLHRGNVFIFAEGSRRGENNMGEFSSGVAQIAQEAGVNVCTLALKNTFKLSSKKPIVCVGETFSVSPREDLKEATRRVKSGVVNAYNKILVYEKER